MASFLFECVNGSNGSGWRTEAKDLERAKRLLHLYTISSEDPFNYMMRPHHIEDNFILVDSVEKETDINAELEEVGLGWILELN